MSTASEVKKLYVKGKSRKVRLILSASAALLALAVISVSLGAGSPRFVEAAQVILSRIFPFLGIDPGSRTVQLIIFDIRLPRVVLAIIVGAGLAASGTTMQGVLRNPLVSPYILGISAAASFGAALIIVHGQGDVIQYGQYMVVVSAFAFSLLAVLIVLAVARLRGMTPETVILTGVAVGFLFTALLEAIQWTASEPVALKEIVYWLLGGRFKDKAQWENILIILPAVLVAVTFMMRHSWDINVMSLGDETAMSLGVNSGRVLVICNVLGALATATIISFTGIIGFLGLVSPHIARMLVGSDHRFLLPSSIVLGASLLLCADTLTRLILEHTEVPVGIVTSLIGVPFFFYLLLSIRRRFWH